MSFPTGILHAIFPNHGEHFIKQSSQTKTINAMHNTIYTITVYRDKITFRIVALYIVLRACHHEKAQIVQAVYMC